MANAFEKGICAYDHSDPDGALDCHFGGPWTHCSCCHTEIQCADEAYYSINTRATYCYDCAQVTYGPHNEEEIATDDRLFEAHDCRDYNTRRDGKTPETADDCEICWLASK